MSEPAEGLLLIDKPAGPTSHDIVARIRSVTGARRVGHTGTLDPPATGLLALVLGRATRLARFVNDAPKTYRGVLTLGVTTTTDDLSGDLMRRHDGSLPDAQAVLAAASLRVGRQLQVPPAFSARHVGGTRLYRSARRGLTVVAPPTEVVVDRFDLASTDAPELWAYELVVSTGTYVRATVRDLGLALGCGAAVVSLRRTAMGPFRVEDALAPPDDPAALRDAVQSRLVPIDAIPLGLRSIVLNGPDNAKRFAAGRVIANADADPLESSLVAVLDDARRLLGVGMQSAGTITPRLVLTPRA